MTAVVAGDHGLVYDLCKITPFSVIQYKRKQGMWMPSFPLAACWDVSQTLSKTSFLLSRRSRLLRVPAERYFNRFIMWIK